MGATTQQLGRGPDGNAAVAMTLAAIAYAEALYLPRQLAYPHYATSGAWTLRWLGVSPGNQMYVAELGAGEQWAVAIRGSSTDPLSESFWIDWFDEDLTTLAMEPLPFAEVPGALIAWGTLQGLDDLVGMRDAVSGQTLADFLAGVELAPQRIAVVGHSLGGCLASVLAAYLYETVCKPAGVGADCIVPITFAAPTAGNAAFAAYLEQLFDGFPSRHVNSLDIAPQTWSLTGLDWVMETYDPAPRIPDYFWLLIDGVRLVLEGGGYEYTQPGAGAVAAGALQDYCWWFQEVGYQHASATYLGFYGGVPVIFPVPPKPPVAGLVVRRLRPGLVSPGPPPQP